MPPCMAAVMVNAGRRSYEEQVKRREEQRGKLREALLNKSRQLGKMFREMDENGDGGVDKAEFRKAVPLLGIPMMKSMPMEDIDDLFDDLDVDGSGTISYKELKKLLLNKPYIKNPVKRWGQRFIDICNSTSMQTMLYAAFVLTFQLLTETLRNPKLEYFYDKMFKDTLIDNHFDSSHNTFEDVRRIADIYEWGNYVLWPGLFGNLGPFDDVGRPGGAAVTSGEIWPDGDGSFHGAGAMGYTVQELVDSMDMMDWTDGIYLRQARVAETPAEECFTTQLAGFCLPEMDQKAVGKPETAPFGYNWTTRGATELTEPYMYWSQERLGSTPKGQMSAAITSMRFQPTGGYIALAIPFFSTAWLPDERGLCDPAAEEVTWYKDTMLNRTQGTADDAVAGLGHNAAFFCVRLSPNGRDCRQLCDPTDIGWAEQLRTRRGRATGAVRGAVEAWWNDLKRGHFLDVHTRVLTITCQFKSNHIGIRYRTTMMFEMTALGGLLPSYDMETMVTDSERMRNMWLFMNVGGVMCLFFVLLEGVEVVGGGPTAYFGDMWNLMDWINFTVFFLVYLTLLQMLRQFNKDLPEPPCSELCQTVGYVDLWELMNTARVSKIYLSVCVCIQLLKIIKFTNVLIPKMGLMTGVLGAGKMDLLFFGIIFGLSMFAFSNLFYIQLGSVMEDFNDQLASFLSLARALFGDFDIDDIMNNSSGYTNAVLFLIYLFVAVFILLSMFLAILGEAQAAVRMEQDDAVETGTAPPEYGVLYYAKERYDEYKEEFRIWQARRSGKDIPRSAMSPDRMEPERPTDEDLYPELDDQMRDLRKAFNTQMNDIRADIDTVAKQLEGARPAPAEGVDPDAGAHTTALIKRFEEKMNRRMTHMEELLFPRSNMWGKVAAATDVVRHHHRRRRTACLNAGLTDTSAKATPQPGCATGTEAGSS